MLLSSLSPLLILSFLLSHSHPQVEASIAAVEKESSAMLAKLDAQVREGCVFSICRISVLFSSSCVARHSCQLALEIELCISDGSCEYVESCNKHTSASVKNTPSSAITRSLFLSCLHVTLPGRQDLRRCAHPSVARWREGLSACVVI